MSDTKDDVRRSQRQDSAHYGSKEVEVRAVPPAEPEATGFRRRTFLKEVPNDILAQCPYCGVGCGTLIQTEKGRIVGMKPDPKHPDQRRAPVHQGSHLGRGDLRRSADRPPRSQGHDRRHHGARQRDQGSIRRVGLPRGHLGGGRADHRRPDRRVRREVRRQLGRPLRLGPASGRRPVPRERVHEGRDGLEHDRGERADVHDLGGDRLLQEPRQRHAAHPTRTSSSPTW